MTPVSPEHRKRRQAAFERAAQVHENSAALHEEAAETFRRLGEFDHAERETAMADQELEAARADHCRAAEQ